MPYSRLNTDFRDMSNVPFNGEMLAILHQAITLPEGTKLQAQRYTYPVKEGVAYDDRTYTLKAEVPATDTATPADVLVSIWLKDTKTTRLTYVGAYIVPEENPPGTPVNLSGLTNQDPEAGLVLAVASIAGLSGTVSVSGNVTVDAASNSLIFNGLRYRGTWDLDTAYIQGDIVTYEHDLWVAARTNNGQTPVEGADWQLFLLQPEVPLIEAAGVNWRGQWVTGTVYTVDDAVEYRGSAWICLANHTSEASGPPAAGSSTWSLIAAAGTGLTWKGPWNNTDTYTKGDGVTYNGRAYIANKEVSANNPPGTSASSLPAGNVATTGGAHLFNIGSTVGHGADQAFDGNNDTYWEGDSDSGYYNAKGIGNIWGTMRTVEKMVIRQHPTDYHNKMPGVFIEVTADGGTTWEVVPGSPFVIPGNGFGTQEIVLSTPIACNGMRIKPNAGQTAGGTGYPWRVYNLEFHAQATGSGNFWDLISDKGVIWKGEWSSATTYAPDDMVKYNGDTWLCLAGHTNVTPAEGATWTKFASKGDPGSGSGTVTSVGLAMPSQFAVSGSPVTDSGTLTAAWNAQAAKNVLAGPASGADAGPTFRQLGLGEMSDVDFSTAPTDGQVLKYDNAASKWKPQADSTGSGSSNTAILSRVYKSGSAQFVDNVATFTKITFATVDYDSGGTAWSTANNEWTVPAAGDYEVAVGLQGISSVSGTNSWNIGVYVNGTERARLTQYATTNQNWASNGHGVVPLPNLASGDKVDVRVGTQNDLNVQVGQYVSWAILKRLK